MSKLLKLYIVQEKALLWPNIGYKTSKLYSARLHTSTYKQLL